jgi:large subunit ribosomal protein L24
MNIRKNDTVQILVGKDNGKRGKVRRVMPRDDMIVVDGLNMMKRHSKARSGVRQAGIIDIESPMHVSNVMLVCSKCSKTTRPEVHYLQDGSKARKCRRCGEVIE